MSSSSWQKIWYIGTYTYLGTYKDGHKKAVKIPKRIKNQKETASFLFFLVSLKPIDAELYRGSSKRQMCSESEEDGKQNAVGNEGREDSERGQ